MRTLLLTTTIVGTIATSAFAQNAPVFRSISDDPTMQSPVVNTTPAPMQKTVPAPIAQPIPAPNAQPTMSTNSNDHTLGTLQGSTAQQPTSFNNNGMQRPTARNGEIIDSVGGGAIPALPLEIFTQNNIQYVSGGVGEEELSQLESQENQFNLRVQLTQENGAYIGGATFNLINQAGETVISVADAGPFVYVQAPAGKYTVEVMNNEGIGKRFNFTLPNSGAIKTQIRL